MDSSAQVPVPSRQQSSTLNVSNSSTRSVSSRIDKPDIDLLIVGNSHSKSIDGSRIYKHKKCSVVTLQDGEKNVDGAINYFSNSDDIPHAAVMILQVASNSLTGMDAVSCIEKCKRLVSVCKLRFPRTVVCLGESLPRILNDSVLHDTYDFEHEKFNQLLRTIPDCVPIRHRNLNSGDDKYFSDNVHLSPTGIARMVGNFKSVVNPLLGLTPYNQYNADSTSSPTRKTARMYHSRQNQNISDNFPRKPTAGNWNDQRGRKDRDYRLIQILSDAAELLRS